MTRKRTPQVVEHGVVPDDALLARDLCVRSGLDPDAWSLKDTAKFVCTPEGMRVFWGNDDVVPLWEHWLPIARLTFASMREHPGE